MERALLSVRDLNVFLQSDDGPLHVVRNVSFDLSRGETLVTVGESGCGKSMTARALMRLLPETGDVPETSRILCLGRDVMRLSEREMQSVRGQEMAMIFQDPSSSLNPTLTVGDQVEESLRLHTPLPKAERRGRALEMLRAVGLSNPELRMNQYPHELSGGMRQRVLIAGALICTPRILLADEPTTALDVTTQADILDLIRDLQRRFDLAVLLITHDLGVAAEAGDRIQVMYAGEIVESAPKRELFRAPAHPYTRALLRSVPRPGEGARLQALAGTPPTLKLSQGGVRCPFAPRCDSGMPICARAAPPEFHVPSAGGGEHRVRCWLRHPQGPEGVEGRNGLS